MLFFICLSSPGGRLLGDPHAEENMVFQIPYWAIPVVAVVWVAFRHMGSADASAQSKQAVFVLALASVLVPMFLPFLATPAVFLQVGLCLYLLQFRALLNALRRAMAPPDRSNEHVKGPGPQ
jgi:hypothetical protein